VFDPLLLQDLFSDLDAISRLDSYEQLNDVTFEGFSSIQRRESNHKNTAGGGGCGTDNTNTLEKGTNTLNRRTIAVRAGGVHQKNHSELTDDVRTLIFESQID
jgi:hypothetical protein